MRDINNVLDAYSPKQIAEHVETIGVAKCAMPTLQTLILAILAGAFIALGGMFYTVVATQTGLPFGPGRWLAGLAFCLGLILVNVGGAELFTGNNLIVMAWADGKVSTRLLFRNWSLVYLGNIIGALLMVIMYYFSGGVLLGDGAVAKSAISIATSKTSLPFLQIFVRGILCNILVCLAIWLGNAARSVTDKILAIIFPISAFVTLGFEHSVANMYLIPIGMLAAGDFSLASETTTTLNFTGFIYNLYAATLGNIIGGSVFVALVYYLIYLRGKGQGM